MVVDGVVGVPVVFLVLMVLVYGKILVRDGLHFLVTFCMILVMGQGQNLARPLVWGDTTCYQLSRFVSILQK